jgi:hypothetical protein
MHTKLFMTTAIPQRLCAIKFEFASMTALGQQRLYGGLTNVRSAPVSGGEADMPSGPGRANTGLLLLRDGDVDARYCGSSDAKYS